MIAVLRTHQGGHRQDRGNDLADDRGQRHSEDSHPEGKDEKKIQENVRNRADDQEIKRPPGIADCPQDSRPDVVDQVGGHARKIDAEIEDGIFNDVCRRIQRRDHRPGKEDARSGKDQSADNGKRHGGMHGPGDILLVSRPVELRNGHGCTGRKSDEKSEKDADQDGGSSPDR